MDNFIGLGVMYSTYVILGILMGYMPYLTRKTESFGVTIPEQVYYSERLQNMRKKFSFQAILILLLLTTSFSVLSFKAITLERATFIYGMGLILLIGSLFVLYLKYHFQMKKLKLASKWEEERPKAIVVDTSFRSRKLAYNNTWFLIPIILTVVTLAITVIYFDRIPERIPLQYDFSGEVTRWADKSYKSIFWVPVQQFLMIALFGFINSTISRAKQQINAANPEKSLVQNHIFRLRWSGFIIVTGTIMVIIFGAIQMSFIFSIDSKAISFISLALTTMIVVYAIILAIFTGQGGSRIKVSSGKDTEEMDRDDDKYWKLGQFYFNPDDPTIFIEKRFGIGWTINFANIKGWLILVGVVLLIIGVQYAFGM